MHDIAVKEIKKIYPEVFYSLYFSLIRSGVQDGCWMDYYDSVELFLTWRSMAASDMLKQWHTQQEPSNSAAAITGMNDNLQAIHNW